MTERSGMVDASESVSSNSACDECGKTMPVVYVKFRYAKSSVPLCCFCWEELKRQVESFIDAKSISSRLWLRPANPLPCRPGTTSLPSR
jgi:hypothetical protein